MEYLPTTTMNLEVYSILFLVNVTIIKSGPLKDVLNIYMLMMRRRAEAGTHSGCGV